MTQSRTRKPSPRTPDPRALLPDRLTAIADVLGNEIEGPVRAQYQLPPKDWRVMKVLAAHGAVPPNEIHRIGGQNKPQISRALKCLLDRELVARQPHPDDDRTFLVSLTAAGSEMYTDIVNKMRRRQADFLKKLPADQADQLRRLLDSLEQIAGD